MTLSSDLIAVLDVGKTNLKLLLATSEGEAVHQVSHRNHFGGVQPYRYIDTAGIERWFLQTLAELSPKYPIAALITSTHGCTGCLCDEDGPVLPMMDYEAQPPAWLAEPYQLIAPPYEEVMTNTGPGILRISEQMLWQTTAFATEFARAKYFLAFPQHISWRLSGSRVSEISFIAAQSHLWAPLRGEFSSTVRSKGWDKLFPPFAKAGAPLGFIRPEVARATGLSGQTQVLCGVHDSNANLYRYKAGGMEQATLLSTGTWMIGFDRSRNLATMDRARGMISNVDIDGAPVASTATMSGREYGMIIGDAPQVPDDAVMAAVQRLIERGTLALPSFAGNDGLFPGSAYRGRIIGPPCVDAAERRAIGALYAAFTAHLCLDALESFGKPVIIDGGFAANRPFARLLAALRPGSRVYTSHCSDGTALGAALLWKRVERSTPVSSVKLEPVLAAPMPGLAQTAQDWANAANANDQR